MTFEEWWNEVYCKAQNMTNVNGGAAAFMASVKRECAKHAWDAGQVMLREQLSREFRAIELEGRKRAKKQS